MVRETEICLDEGFVESITAHNRSGRSAQLSLVTALSSVSLNRRESGHLVYFLRQLFVIIPLN